MRTPNASARRSRHLPPCSWSTGTPFAVAATLLLSAALPACTTLDGPLFDRDQDGYPLGHDCDDNNPAVGPQYQDMDGDGFGSQTMPTCDLTASGRTMTPGDCDDNNPNIHPDALEVCDVRQPSPDATPPYGLDNDCDGTIDEGVSYTTWYQDHDGDGYGDAAQTLIACTQPAGYALTPGDCDDENPARSPGVQETCNDFDDNCSGGNGDFYVDTSAAETGTPGNPDASTIQDALAVALEGCSIEVAPGVYRGPIDFAGKTLHLRSAEGPDTTFIDGEDQGVIFRFQSGESSDAIVEGFTLQNGSGDLFEVCCPTDEVVYGGAVFISASSPSIRNNVFARNSAEVGGAIAVYGGSPVIQGNRFLNNTAIRYGSAIFLYDVTNSVVSDNTFEQNATLGPATSGEATVDVQRSSFVTFQRNTFTDNQANAGGAIVIVESTQVVVSDSTFERNAANVLGGAIAVVHDAEATIQDSVFIQNTATNGGGAIVCQGDQTPVQISVSGNWFDGNEGGDNGGGIYLLETCAGEIVHNVFLENRATRDGYGGAIDAKDTSLGTASPMQVSNNLFVSNEASYGGAMAVRGDSNAVLVWNNTFWDNGASVAGGAAFMTDETPDFQNNLVTFSQTGTGLFYGGLVGLTVTKIQYNDFHGNADGPSNIPGLVGQNGNVDVDPEYQNAVGFDFTLSPGSPVVDAGNPEAAHQDTDGSRNDMGAYGGPLGDW